MKILHISNNFYPNVGGIETFILESSKRIIKLGHKILVLTSDKTVDNRKLKKHEIINGIEIIRVPFYKFFRYNLSFEALRKALVLDCDLIHIHGFGFLSDMIPLLKIFRKKILISTHGGIFHTKNIFFLKKLYFHTLLRLSLFFVDKVIAHSLEDKKIFSKIVDRKKIALVNYGIDWEFFKKSRWKGNGKTLLYIGRISKNKRLDRMLHVVYLLKKTIPDVKLIIAGPDWGEKKKLIELSKYLNVSENILFIGPIPHKKIIKYLSNADIFLLSSDYEGFGISVLEAMASGLPVVVNDIPTMREIILNGKNGFITDFKNYKNTSNLIIKILKNNRLRKRIKESARNSTKKYDWGIISKNLMGVYRNEKARFGMRYS